MQVVKTWRALLILRVNVCTTRQGRNQKEDDAHGDSAKQ